MDFLFRNFEYHFLAWKTNFLIENFSLSLVHPRRSHDNIYNAFYLFLSTSFEIKCYILPFQRYIKYSGEKGSLNIWRTHENMAIDLGDATRIPKASFRPSFTCRTRIVGVTLSAPLQTLTPSAVPLINWSIECNPHKTSARGRTEFDISVCLFCQNSLQRWCSVFCVLHDPQRHSVRISKLFVWNQRSIVPTALVIQKIHPEFIWR